MSTEERAPFLSMEASWEALYPNIRWLAFFCVLTHPVFFLINATLDNGVDSPYLRAVCCLLAIPWCFRSVVRASRSDFGLRLYGILLIFFALPFFFFSVLFLNQSIAGIELEQLASRQIQAAFSVVAISLLIYSPKILICGLVTSLVLAILYVFALSGPPTPMIDFLVPLAKQLPFWVFAVVAGVYFNRNKAVVELEKLQTLSDAGSYLAHELRTPLTGIATRIKGVERYLPVLMQGFRRNESNTSGLNENKLRLLEESCSDVIEQVEYAHSLINMFLVRSNKNIAIGADLVDVSGQELVSKAIEMYPFASSSEKDMIEVECQEDFVVTGPKLIYVHVLLNLLKNAIRYAHKASDRWVGISIYLAGRDGVIAVADRGPGIRKQDFGKIFEHFYSTSAAGEGFGVGLSFCRRVLEGVGGSVTVESEPYKLTRFILRFPL